MRKEKIIEKNWLLTQNQWKILMTLEGKSWIYGYEFLENKIEKRQLIEEIYHMVQKRILRVEEEKLVVDKAYCLFMECAKQAKIMCRCVDKELGEYLLFMGESCLVSRPVEGKKEGILFSVKSHRETLLYLFEEGFFEKYQIGDTKELEFDDPKLVGLEKEPQEVLSLENISGMIDMMQIKTEQRIGRILIQKEKGEEYISWEKRKKRGKRLYTEENVVEIWKEMFFDGIR